MKKFDGFADSVPKHYEACGIRHWSPAKINKPFWYVLCEYGYRQPRYWKAKHESDQGDAEADLLVAHYTLPRVIKMIAGSVAADAAFEILNGKSRRDAVENALSILRKHTPHPFNERDVKTTKHLLDDNGQLVEQTIENVLDALRIAFAGANSVETEERHTIELPGVDVPVLGFSDGRGAGVIAEVKTKWDTIDGRSKTGFKNNSVPSRPAAADILQLAVYQRATGGVAKLIYANRKNHVIFPLDQDVLDEAIDIATAICKKRQRIMERCGEFDAVVDCVEPDWGHYLLSDWSAELKQEIKSVFSA
jgi:hypothetical protein